MKRTLITTLIAFALAGHALAAAPGPAPAPPAGDSAGDGSGAAAAGAARTPLDEAIDGIEAFYRNVTDFKAAFAQEVKRAHLPRPLKKSGHVYFKAPGRMRWDYAQPERVYYVSDGTDLWSYEQTTRQAIKMRVKDSDLYDSLKFLFGQGDLRGSFDITLAPKASAADEKAGLVGVVLVPKSGQQNYKSLTLWAKRGTWEIARSELVDPLDNVSTIAFTKPEYTELKPEGFAFVPPEGAHVQDLTAPPGSGSGSGG